MVTFRNDGIEIGDYVYAETLWGNKLYGEVVSMNVFGQLVIEGGNVGDEKLLLSAEVKLLPPYAVEQIEDVRYWREGLEEEQEDDFGWTLSKVGEALENVKGDPLAPFRSGMLTEDETVGIAGKLRDEYPGIFADLAYLSGMTSASGAELIPFTDECEEVLDSILEDIKLLVMIDPDMRR